MNPSSFIVVVRGSKLQALLTARVGEIETKGVAAAEREDVLAKNGGYMPMDSAASYRRRSQTLATLVDLIDPGSDYSLTLSDLSMMDLLDTVVQINR